MTKIVASGLFAGSINHAHFGANILSTRDKLDDDGTYAAKVDELGVGTIRFPGGSITEYFFDENDPDRETAVDPKSGKVIDLLTFSEFMEFAEETGRAALIVLPTRTQLGSRRDANGDRFDAVDEDGLRKFVQDTLNGEYGNARIAGFEIGNEYWGSGEMTSVEYGRVASTMTRIVHEEVKSHPDHDELFFDTEIHVQMGQNYGSAKMNAKYDGTAEEQLAQFMADYDLDLSGNFISSAGDVTWTKLNNHLIMREFDLPEEIAGVDGIVAHIYSRGEHATFSQTFELRTIEQTWGQDPNFASAKPVVTEWNVKNPGRNAEEDFGLIQAGQMLDIVEVFGLFEVSSAYTWAIQQNSQSSLTGNEGDTTIKVGGEFFSMMSEALPGTRPVVLQGAKPGESETVVNDAEIHVFAGVDKAVFYIQSLSDDENLSSQIDISGIVSGFDSIKITKLGVAPGDSVGNSRATPVKTELPPEDHYDNGIISAELSPREIIQIVLEGVDFAPEMSGFLPVISGGESEIVIPTVEETIEEREAREARETEEGQAAQGDGDDGGIGDMAALLLLIPVVLLGFAMA